MNSGHYDSKSFQRGQINQQNLVPSHSTHYNQQHGPKNQHQANLMVNQTNGIPVQQQIMNTQMNIANDTSVVAKHHMNSIPAQQTISNQMSHYDHSGNYVTIQQNQLYPSTSHHTAPNSGKLKFLSNIV